MRHVSVIDSPTRILRPAAARETFTSRPLSSALEVNFLVHLQSFASKIFPPTNWWEH